MSAVGESWLRAYAGEMAELEPNGTLRLCAPLMLQLGKEALNHRRRVRSGVALHLVLAEVW